MPALASPRREAFARALASGLSPKAAGAKAGFDPKGSNANVRAQRADVRNRVTELKADASAEDRDLRPVIKELMDLSAAARALNTAASMASARWLLVEAARLKAQLPLPARPRYSLSHAEWNERFVPKTEHTP